MSTSKKRSMSSADKVVKRNSGIEDLLDIESKEVPESAVAGISTQKATFETTNDHLRLSDVSLNYRNKRVVTQLIRFIPDDVAEAALKQSSNKQEIQHHVLSNLDKILVNNIIREFRKSDMLKDSDGADNSSEKHDLIDMKNYSRHDDLYNPDKEGIFIGKGICFHNIQSENCELLKQIDSFTEAVNLNGSSLDVESNGDVIEKPKVVRIGGQRSRLIFGHQRYSYLVFAYGLEHVYVFLSSRNHENQNRQILLENNTKRIESGYEQLLSYYHTARESGVTDWKELSKVLALSHTNFYRVKPFIDDPELLKIIKQEAIHLPRHTLTTMLEEIKTALKSLGHEITETMVRDAFANKLKALGIVRPTTKQESNKTAPTIVIRIPQEIGALDKLLFSDVRTWSKLDVNNYDLTDKKSIKQYLHDLLEEIN